MNYTIVNSDSYYFYVKLMAKPGPAAGKILKIDYGKPCLFARQYKIRRLNEIPSLRPEWLDASSNFAGIVA